jgi:dTMP kinase
VANGLFIVLDGPDGCGKSTQAARLADRLRSAGRDPLHLREPGGTPAGERIRAMLLDQNVQLGPAAEAFLFMAARAQLVDDVLEPALRTGRTVVCERWISSTMAYQGVAGGFGAERVADLGRAALRGLVPDILVLLDLPADVGLARVPRGLDRMEKKGEDYHRRVREGFRDTLRYFPRTAVLDASRTPDHVAAAVWDAVKGLL